MDRTTMTFAALAAAGLLAATAGRDDALSPIRPAFAQQDEERETSPSESAERAVERAESELARAAEAGDAATPVETIGVAESEEHGQYLVDGQGRAVYLLESESDGESRCYDECAEEWPPVLASGEEPPAAEGDAVRSDLLGTVERRDGERQVTYGGYPLYYYERDGDAGDVKGQAVSDDWGEWYLVTPEGEPLEGGEHEGDRG